MRKKRSITLLEIMIVILLIGLVGGVISYNLKGSLDKGKKFRTEEGAKKLEDIINLEIQTGSYVLSEMTDPKNIKRCLENSRLIPVREIDKMMLDGWNSPYEFKLEGDQIKVSSVHMSASG